MKRKTTIVRQKEIVLAARKLIVKCGSGNVTLKRIANEIGVSDAAIYKHFKSKKDVLAFLIDDIGLILTEDIEKNYTAELDSLKVLENIILEHISAISQRRGVAFQVIAEIISLGDTTLNKKVSQVIAEYIQRIGLILMDGVKTGIIRPDIDVAAAAKLFFGMTQGLVNIWALNRYKTNLEQEYKSMWTIFLRAISKSE